MSRRVLQDASSKAGLWVECLCSPKFLHWGKMRWYWRWHVLRMFRCDGECEVPLVRLVSYWRGQTSGLLLSTIWKWQWKSSPLQARKQILLGFKSATTWILNFCQRTMRNKCWLSSISVCGICNGSLNWLSHFGSRLLGYLECYKIKLIGKQINSLKLQSFGSKTIAYSKLWVGTFNWTQSGTHWGATHRLRPTRIHCCGPRAGSQWILVCQIQQGKSHCPSGQAKQEGCPVSLRERSPKHTGKLHQSRRYYGGTTTHLAMIKWRER